MWVTSALALACGVAGLYLWSTGNVVVAVICGLVAVLSGFTASRINQTMPAGAQCLECQRPIRDGQLFCSPDHDLEYNSSTAW